jgi:hypothetical protein
MNDLFLEAMSVKISFAKGAKSYEVIEEQYEREAAEELAVQAAGSSISSSLSRIMRREQEPPEVSSYQKTFHPFWVVQGESLFEYKRRNHYEFDVPPEVQKIYLKKDTLSIDPDKGTAQVDATDHCFEQYEKEIIQDAMDLKGKKFAPYMEYPRKSIKSLDKLNKKDQMVPDVQVRASYSLNLLYGEIIKPINADEILQAKVVVNQAKLVLLPIHIVEVTQGAKSKTFLVDAATGKVSKESSMVKQLTGKYWSGETVFDLGSELAGNIIPGAGMGMILAKKAMSKRQETKAQKTRKKFSSKFKG